MGYNQSKEQVIAAQIVSSQGQVETKLNNYGFMLMALVALVIFLLVIWAWRKCNKGVKSWVKKQITIANLQPPVVRVHTVQQQPAATGTGYV